MMSTRPASNEAYLDSTDAPDPADEYIAGDDDPYDDGHVGRTRRARVASASTDSDQDDPDGGGDQNDDDEDQARAKKPFVVRVVDTAKGLGGKLSPVRTWYSALPSNRQNVVKALAALAAVTLVLLFIVPKFTGGDEPGEASDGGASTPFPTSAAPLPNVDGVIAVDRNNVTADCANGSSSPALAFSTSSKDAWRCMRYFSADGVELTIRFSKPVTISKIDFVPGWNYVEPSVDNWTKWRVIKEVLWIVGEDQYPQSITPTRSGVTQRFRKPVSTSVLKMVILKTEPASGSKSNNSIAGSWSTTEDGFALSKMRIFGRESQ